MTYEDIIDLFATACAQHYQINEFSTSPLLSDLEVGTKGTQTPAVYPYVFLQPIGGSLAQGEMQYQFNMIVMDRVKQNMDKETNTISDMIQIGQDLIAYWNFSVPRPDAYIALPISVTPFVERFDNMLAGATFNISVNTPFVLDKCIAPFKPVPTPSPVDCTNYINLSGGSISTINGSYESASYGYWSVDSGTGTGEMIYGVAPDGNNYKVYFKAGSDYAVAAVFIDDVIDLPPNSYNWIDIEGQSWFGSSAYELLNGSNYIAQAGTFVDYVVSYPEC